MIAITSDCDLDRWHRERCFRWHAAMFIGAARQLPVYRQTRMSREFRAAS